jgi:hypothetical protein
MLRTVFPLYFICILRLTDWAQDRKVGLCLLLFKDPLTDGGPQNGHGEEEGGG